MIQRSLFLDLREQGFVWGSARIDLPERIVTPKGESLERMSLPNASLCADFLTTATNVWAGITICVSNDDVSAVWKVFEQCSPKLVRLIRPEQARTIDRYSSYADWNWIEILWIESNELALVEVQTNEIIWYAQRRQIDGMPKIVLLGLEDLPSLLSEPGELMDIPLKWK